MTKYDRCIFSLKYSGNTVKANFEFLCTMMTRNLHFHNPSTDLILKISSIRQNTEQFDKRSLKNRGIRRTKIYKFINSLQQFLTDFDCNWVSINIYIGTFIYDSELIHSWRPRIISNSRHNVTHPIIKMILYSITNSIHIYSIKR